MIDRRYLLLFAAAGIVTTTAMAVSEKLTRQTIPQSQAGSVVDTNITPSPIQRCVNVAGAMDAPNEGDWGYVIREIDIARISAAGFDTIRLPVRISAHTSMMKPYKISPDILARIDEVSGWAVDNGLQVIIDVHNYEELNENADAHEPRLEAIWQQLSRRYANAPDNIMFELINEPYGDMTIARTDALNRRLLDIVRKDNPDRWVVVGSAQWGTLDGLLQSNPPRDPKVITTFHYYTPFPFTHQGAPWAHEQHALGIKWRGNSGEMKELSSDMVLAAEWRNKTGMPMLLGEFGVYRLVDDTNRARWTKAVRREAEKHGIGWCYWEFATEFKLYDPTIEQWRPGLRDALMEN